MKTEMEPYKSEKRSGCYEEDGGVLVLEFLNFCYELNMILILRIWEVYEGGKMER